jgi:hypothetical protein
MRSITWAPTGLISNLALAVNNNLAYFQAKVNAILALRAVAAKSILTGGNDFHKPWMLLRRL